LSDSPQIAERVARSVVYVGISRVLMQILSTLSGLLLARWLSPEDYGVMALAAIAAGLIYLIAELGVGSAIIQFPDLQATELNAGFWVTLLLGGLLYTVMYLIAPYLAGYFSIPRISALLRVIGLGAVLSVLRIVPESLLRKRLHLDKVAIIEIVSAVVNVPLMLGLAWVGAGLWALAAGAVFGPFIQCLLSFSFARWWPGLRIESERFSLLLRYSWAAVGSKFAWAVYSESDRIVLGRLAGDVTLGFYTMANQVALLPVEKIAAVVNQISAPVLAECQADQEAMRRCFLREVRIIAWTVVPICFGIVVFADAAVPLLLTAKWTPIIPVLQLLSLFAALRSLILLFPPVLMAGYRADFLFRYNLLLVIVMPAAFGVGAWWKGGVGVALAWSLVYPLVAVWMANRGLQVLGMTWGALGRELRAPVASTIVMLAMAVVAHKGLSGQGTAGLIVAILIGAVVYGGAVLLFGGIVIGDVRLLFGILGVRSAAGPKPLPRPGRSESNRGSRL
jgi:O-antigen/teichoic acid export membrane protein